MDCCVSISKLTQIIDDISSLKLTKAGEPLEISLTKNLKHLGIMSTLTYTYSDASAVPTSSSKTGGSSRQRTLDTRPGRRVCWMLFEYCDKGVLAVGCSPISHSEVSSSNIGLHAMYVVPQPVASGLWGPVDNALLMLGWPR